MSSNNPETVTQASLRDIAAYQILVDRVVRESKRSLTYAEKPLVSTYVDTIDWVRRMRTEIKKWGNSAALRLPAATLAKAGLEVNSPVEIEAAEGKLVVSAVNVPQYNLAELLAQCPPKKIALTDEDKRWLESEPVGKEVW